MKVMVFPESRHKETNNSKSIFRMLTDQVFRRIQLLAFVVFSGTAFSEEEQMAVRVDINSEKTD